ncbi:hypothetical protein LINPERHAP2_LOCUS29149 [Linum perenne]
MNCHFMDKMNQKIHLQEVYLFPY